MQELLQGFSGPKQAEALIERFRSLPLISPDRQDHIAAAQLRNACRKRGVQGGTIDARFAQLSIRHDLLMLTTDADFQHMARVVPELKVLDIKRCSSSLIRPSGTFSRWKKREKATAMSLLPPLLAGEGARRADEGTPAPC